MKTRVTKTINSNTEFKGVHKHKKTNKYEARFTFGTRTQYIGSFNTLDEAVQSREEYIIGLI